jgi:internalin A
MNRTNTLILKLEDFFNSKFSQYTGTYQRGGLFLKKDKKGNVTYLNVADRKIPDVKDFFKIIKQLDSLESLVLRNNDITDSSDVNLLEVKRLRKIEIAENNLSDVDFLAGCHHLENVSFTRVPNLDLGVISTLIELRSLSLSVSNVSDITSLKNLHQLETLELASNFITDISALSNLNLKTLNIDENHIDNIHPLSRLKSLNYLSASRNLIATISPISKLVNLKSLYLSHNSNVSNITPLSKLHDLSVLLLFATSAPNISALANLKKLTYLDLDGNGISSISALKDLTELETLDLRNNNIIDISPLQKLSKLEKLFLQNNRIENIDSIKSLNNLYSLHLNSNRIQNIDGVFNKNLRELSLSGNRISCIANAGTLAHIPSINLASNTLKELPIWVKKYKGDIIYKNDLEGQRTEGLNIFNNPLENPPVEFVKQGKEGIMSWLKSGKKTQIREVKVLFVGHGDVGKTTLIKCITGQKTNPKEIATDKINITPYSLKIADKTVKLNFWDFGGQEVMHATHQFFLSKRSIYVLVLDGRRDEDAEYWLKHIESFGGNSPVLIALNKIDSNPAFDVNRQFLLEKFPFIVGFYKTECITSIKGISELSEGLKNVLGKVQMLTTPWPRTWLGVKNSIEETKADVLSQNEYEKICEQYGIIDARIKEWLAEFLNDLGAVVHFNDSKMSHLHILQPRWASGAAYRIINSPQIAANKGIFAEGLLNEVLKKRKDSDYEYQPYTHIFIVELMKKFELCYSIGNRQYLIPELLDIQQPTLPTQTGAVLKFFFKYEDLLPFSIMPRFIVRMHSDIHQNVLWRTGVVLSIPLFESYAIVRADVKERKIYISISGRGRREHFAIIRKTFHDLNKTFEKLAVTEWIPLPDHDSHAIEYADLLGYEESKQEEYFIGKLKKKYSVKSLLNGIEHESVRTSEYKWDVFLCHSSKDKPIVRKIVSDLKKYNISYWLDEERIDPGDSIIDSITEGLQNSKIIIPCLSENQATSGWSKKEYQLVLGKIIGATSKQRVTPLVLDSMPDANIPYFLTDVLYTKYEDAEQYAKLLTFLGKKDISGKN